MQISLKINRLLNPLPHTGRLVYRFLSQSWKGYRSTQCPASDLQTVLATLESLTTAKSPTQYDEEIPIFLLAVGWRTGSTLLQRILVTDPSLLVWGEPLGRSIIIPRLTRSICTISREWPPAEYWIDNQIGDLTTTWIANLFPPINDLRAAWQEMIIHWLGKPARARGYHRWGLKEVRLGAAEACFLRWLFPRAKFLVLLRHPLDAYLSAQNMKFWYSWPDWPIDCPVTFARHWNRLALSWQAVPDDFGYVIIKYEDLISSQFDFRQLEQSLGLKVDEQIALAKQVGSSLNPNQLSWYEYRSILKESREGMEAYGYE